MSCRMFLAIIVVFVLMVAAQGSSIAKSSMPTKEIHKLEEKAKAGDAKAQAELGLMYIKGKGVKQDYIKAAYYFEQAAEQGNAGAQGMLGYMYHKGLGLKQNYQKAKECYEQAAKQGYSMAQYHLGSLYYYGREVTQDYQEAVYWFEQAAKQGLAGAQYNLGLMYVTGEGVKQDYKKAKEYLELAAIQGVKEAQRNLGVLYAMGIDIKQDYVKARHYFELGTEQGDAESQYMLGLIYAKGDGVKQDDVKARYYFEQAAEQGLVDAKEILKRMGDEGKENNVFFLVLASVTALLVLMFCFMIFFKRARWAKSLMTPICSIIYIVLGIFQYLAVYAFLYDYWDWNFFPAMFVGFVLAGFPMKCLSHLLEIYQNLNYKRRIPCSPFSYLLGELFEFFEYLQGSIIQDFLRFLLGSICGIIGAMYAWQWAWWQAGLLFLWWIPLILIVLISSFLGKKNEDN